MDNPADCLYYEYPPYVFGIEYPYRQNNILLAKSAKGGNIIKAMYGFINYCKELRIQYVMIQSPILLRRAEFIRNVLGLQAYERNGALFVQVWEDEK